MPIFGRSKKVDVLNHWYALIPDFQTSSQEFYGAIEKELEACQVPGLEISRVDFSEGGLLSSNREYLRMSRERLIFDVCAAPFGTSYFYSMRFAEIPSAIKPWEIALALLTLFTITALTMKIFGFWFGSFLLLAMLAATIWFARNVVALGLQDLDTSLIKTPVLGPVYERFFRKETYYRTDTRLMYLESIDAIVKRQVEAATSKKGIKLMSIKQHSPLLSGMYNAATLQQPNAPADKNVSA